ncbi:MAG TPA: hypothetical protein VFY16_01040 [Gemmatimonadaceae bacterium]|nr:hypothetical protein [Gemmatimonadaceae bacterium]
MPPTTIFELSFLTGVWEGDSVTLQIELPLGDMLFGSMQSVQEGHTVYWETWRFAVEDGRLVCHPSQMGKPMGRYPLVSRVGGSAPSLSFEDRANAQHRRLTWSAEPGGHTLVVTMEGERRGTPYQQVLRLRRREESAPARSAAS